MGTIFLFVTVLRFPSTRQSCESAPEFVLTVVQCWTHTAASQKNKSENRLGQ